MTLSLDLILSSLLTEEFGCRCLRRRLAACGETAHLVWGGDSFDSDGSLIRFSKQNLSRWVDPELLSEPLRDRRLSVLRDGDDLSFGTVRSVCFTHSLSICPVRT